MSKDIWSGHARWLFRLQWSPGGEECIWPDRQDELQHAWWNPPSALSHQKVEDMQSSPNIVDEKPPMEPEDAFNTTLRYRQARIHHHEYKFRNNPLQELYCYILPPHLFVPFSSQLSDANFPRGWICSACGRMNFQKAIRHRKCPSKKCKVCLSRSQVAASRIYVSVRVSKRNHITLIYSL